jgi:hypothetical protein
MSASTQDTLALISSGRLATSITIVALRAQAPIMLVQISSMSSSQTPAVSDSEQTGRVIMTGRDASQGQSLL